MKMFCFDLTWAVIAHRAGRGPDFLVHDSKIYDGVDERQVARALELAARVTGEEGMQYIVTMNSDDLAKAERMGLDRKSTRLNSNHVAISYAVFCLKKKKKTI